MHPLLITGFHRSGTSAVARTLHAAGLHLGDELLGAEPANPYGHYEDIGVVALHDEALAAQGLTWKSTTGPIRPIDSAANVKIRRLVSERSRTDAPWGVKDPRLCLFLSEWLEAEPRSAVVVVIRRPDEVIQSLHRRHTRRSVDTRRRDASDLDFWRTPDLGLRLWIHYYERLLAALPPDDQVLFVDYSDRDQVDRIVDVIATRWHLPLTTEDVPALDPRLGAPSVKPVEVRDRALLVEATTLWTELRARIDTW
ncbi:MAG: hypothetical protein ACI81L_003456 [Verrucomicrobiales bacterium]|jgi:hypothetical protein